MSTRDTEWTGNDYYGWCSSCDRPNSVCTCGEEPQDSGEPSWSAQNAITWNEQETAVYDTGFREGVSYMTDRMDDLIAQARIQGAEDAGRLMEVALEVPDYYSDRVSKFRSNARQKFYKALAAYKSKESK